MVQNVVNAVLTAACFGYDAKTHTKSACSDVLGVNSKTAMTWAVDYAYKMHNMGQTFSRIGSTKRSDCMKEIACHYVAKFYHSQE